MLGLSFDDKDMSTQTDVIEEEAICCKLPGIFSVEQDLLFAVAAEVKSTAKTTNSDDLRLFRSRRASYSGWFPWCCFKHETSLSIWTDDAEAMRTVGDVFHQKLSVF